MLFLILQSCSLHSPMLYSCCRHNGCSCCWYRCGILRSSLHHYCKHVHARTMLMTIDLLKTASPSDCTCNVGGHLIWDDPLAALNCSSSNTLCYIAFLVHLYVISDFLKSAIAILQVFLQNSYLIIPIKNRLISGIQVCFQLSHSIKEILELSWVSHFFQWQFSCCFHS